MEQELIYSSLIHKRKGSLISMKKIILIIALIALLTSVAFAVYLFNKPHQSIAHEEPAYNLEAAALIGDYDKNEKEANAKYLGKIVEVKGVISEKSKDSKGFYNITLQGPDLAGVGCQFEPAAQEYLSGLKEGQEVCIKGVCSGVLMDVVLVDCCITKDSNSK